MKVFLVDAKDLFNKKKNAHLKLSAESALKNPKIKKKMEVKDESKIKRS